MTRAERNVPFGIVLVAFVARLAWALYARADPPVDWFKSGDQYSYYRYGSDIAHGRGYIGYLTGEPTAYYPIGYPAVLGALYFFVIHTPLPDDLLLATSLFHVLLSTVSVLLVFAVGRRIAGIRAGLVAALVLALFPNIVFQVSTVQLETTFIFLVLVAMVVVLEHDWSTGPPSRGRLLAFGAALGAAVLVRPFALVLVVGVAAAVASGRAGWRSVVGAVAVPVAVVALISLPWTIRNHVQMGAFIPSSTNMGDTLCLDRNLDATGGFRFADHDGCVDPKLAEVPRNRGNTRKAIEFVLQHPDREALQIVRRARIMFQDDHDGIVAVQTLGGGAFLSERVVDVAEPVADWYFYGVVALAILGLPQLARPEERARRWILASGTFGLLAIPLLLWGNPRFHLPLAPFLVLLAALAVDAGIRRLRSRSTA